MREHKKGDAKNTPIDKGKNEEKNAKGSDVEMSEMAKSEANGHQENGVAGDGVETVEADFASQSVYGNPPHSVYMYFVSHLR